MQIDRVHVVYGELRSTGYPNFSNKRFEVGYSAKISEDESIKDARRHLLEMAIKDVKILHGDEVAGLKLMATFKTETDVEVPF